MREKVLQLLRQGPRTVNELAELLDLTDNGVRVHLTALERAGLVARETLRRNSVGKPAHVFKLTAEADSLFPKGYRAILAETMDYLYETFDPDDVEHFLRGVGRHAGEAHVSKKQRLAARVRDAAAALGSLGGVAEVVEEDDALTIHGSSCPLSGVVSEHPQACILAEELIATIVGAPVQECCDRSGPPKCRFRVER